MQQGAAQKGAGEQNSGQSSQSPQGSDQSQGGSQGAAQKGAGGQNSGQSFRKARKAVIKARAVLRERRKKVLVGRTVGGEFAKPARQ